MADPDRKFPYGLTLWLMTLLLANAWFNYRFAAQAGSPQLLWVAHASMALAIIAILVLAAWWWKWRKK